MKTPKPPVTPQAPSPAPSAPQPTGLLTFDCLHCGHHWQHKRRASDCPACNAPKFWIPKPKTSARIAPLFYDGGNGSYWLQLLNGEFIKVDSRSAQLHWKAAGIEHMTGKDYLNASEQQLYLAQTERHVHYAGPLAGHKRGLVTLPSGMRVLVTTEANTPKAKGGDWPFIEGFLFELLGPDRRQVRTFLAWAAMARQSQMRGDFRPGHSLALCGPSQCGKSFLAAVVARLLGGRVEKPFAYMSGKTRFNGELSTAEFLLIDDEASSANYQSRKALAANIKQLTVVEEMRAEFKGRTPFNAPTFRRLMVIFNEGAEDISVHPPLDDGLADKVLLLKCKSAKLHEDRLRNMEAVKAELPAFAAFLDRYKVPVALTEPGWCPCPLCVRVKASAASRFGFLPFHHPEIVASLAEISSEENLWGILLQTLWPRPGDETAETGTSEAIERRVDETSFKGSKDRLMTFTGAFASLLGKLAAKADGRVTKSLKEGRAHWTLSKP